MSPNKLTYHEIANLFPMMDDEDFKSLKTDIEVNGQQIPIAVYKNQILDGRNRYKACQELGINPLIKVLEDKTDPLDYAVSVNIKRRNLNRSQRAFIAQKLGPFYEKQAKERQRAHGGTAPGKKSLTPKMEGVISGEATAAAGKAVGVSRSYVAAAKKIAESNPEMVEQIKSGELSIPQAELKIKKDENYKKEAERRDNLSIPPMPPTNFDLILADPPWGKEPDQLRTDELSRIKLPSNETCILFFWSPGPKIPDALFLFRCWGFEYHDCVVWDNWQDAEEYEEGLLIDQGAEFLLVGIKGNLKDLELPYKLLSPLSDPTRDVEGEPRDSIYSDDFPYGRDDNICLRLENAFPSTSKVELFTEEPREGWTAWGSKNFGL